MGAFDIELLLHGLYPGPDGHTGGGVAANRAAASSIAAPGATLAATAAPARRPIPRHPAVWRMGERPAVPLRVVPCGVPGLERQLPGGGWPLGCITEVINTGMGIGEVSLLLPALARLSRQGETVVLVAPPFVPYAPALQQAGVDMAHILWVDARDEADAVWAAEQSLRSGSCGAVLVWPGRADNTALRRLQLAAEAGGAWCAVMRDRSSAGAASPAAVRVEVDSDGRRRQVRLLKCRGGHHGHVSLAA